MAERQFGPYRLIRQVAVGGMAEIHLAKTAGIAGFEKYVALKMIHPNFAEDEQFIQMLVDEAKIAVQLTHGNIAQTFDLGRVGDTYYITMEYVDGADLYKILRRASEQDREIPLDVCAFVGKEIASALDHAHRKRDHTGKSLGIVHRDVSPQNVLVSYSGEVKLVDFGIAKATMKARQTAVGVIKGKYYYMSPEQAWGDPIDHRSDIFSAGIVLYEMITGQMLYLEEDLHKLLEMARTADIAPPGRLRRGVPPQLERIVMHALTKLPGERYQTAGDLATDLERFLHAYSPVFTASKLSQLLREVIGDPLQVPDAPAGSDVEFRDGVMSTHPLDDAEVAHAIDRAELRDENSVIFRMSDLEGARPGKSSPPPLKPQHRAGGAASASGGAALGSHRDQVPRASAASAGAGPGSPRAHSAQLDARANAPSGGLARGPTGLSRDARANAPSGAPGLSREPGALSGGAPGFPRGPTGLSRDPRATAPPGAPGLSREPGAPSTSAPGLPREPTGLARDARATAPPGAPGSFREPGAPPGGAPGFSREPAGLSRDARATAPPGAPGPSREQDALFGGDPSSGSVRDRRAVSPPVDAEAGFSRDSARTSSPTLPMKSTPLPVPRVTRATDSLPETPRDAGRGKPPSIVRAGRAQTGPNKLPSVRGPRQPDEDTRELERAPADPNDEGSGLLAIEPTAENVLFTGSIEGDGEPTRESPVGGGEPTTGQPSVDSPNRRDGSEPTRRDDGSEPTRRDGSEPTRRDDRSEPTRRDDGSEPTRRRTSERFIPAATTEITEDDLENIAERTQVTAAPGSGPPSTGFMISDDGDGYIETTVVTAAPTAGGFGDDDTTSPRHDAIASLDGNTLVDRRTPIAADPDGSDLRDQRAPASAPAIRTRNTSQPAALSAKIHAPAVSELRKPRTSRRTPPTGTPAPPNVLQAIVASQVSEPMPAPRPSPPPPPPPPHGAPLASHAPPSGFPPPFPDFGPASTAYSHDASGLPLGLPSPSMPSMASLPAPAMASGPLYLAPAMPVPGMPAGYPPPPPLANPSPYPAMSPGALYQFQPSSPPQALTITGQMRLLEVDELPPHYRLTRRRWLTYIVAGGAAVAVAALTTFLVIRTTRAPAPAFGSVHVESVPLGAEVRYDGTLLSRKTPLTIDRVPVGGRHVIRLELRHYDPYEQTIEIPAHGGDVTVATQLVPSTGKLTVETTPPNAEIRIDGELRGRAPTTIDVDRGSARRLELRLKDHQPHVVNDLTRMWPSDGKLQIKTKLEPVR